MGVGFPYGTLIVNVTGCFLIGVFSVLADEKFILGPQSRVLLITGFCGAYTTFSAYIFETGGLVKNGEIAGVFLNILISTLAGYAAYLLGSASAKAF